MNNDPSAMRVGHFLYTKNAPVIADALQNAAMTFFQLRHEKRYFTHNRVYNKVKPALLPNTASVMC